RPEDAALKGQPPVKPPETPRFAVKGDTTVKDDRVQSTSVQKAAEELPEEQARVDEPAERDPIERPLKIDQPKKLAKSAEVKSEREFGDDIELKVEIDAETGAELNNEVLMRPTYILQKRDTLVSIARDFFNDEYLCWLILNLNKGALKQSEMDGKIVVE